MEIPCCGKKIRTLGNFIEEKGGLKEVVELIKKNRIPKQRAFC